MRYRSGSLSCLLALTVLAVAVVGIPEAAAKGAPGGAGRPGAAAAAARPLARAAGRGLLRPRGSIPRALLDGLPRRLHRAVTAAYETNGSETTLGMVQSESLVREFMEPVLFGLAARAYKREYFRGKTIERYYRGILNRLSPTVWKAWNAFGGTMYHVIANGDMTTIVEEYLVQVVRDQTDAAYFRQWKRKWDRARSSDRRLMMRGAGTQGAMSL